MATYKLPKGFSRMTLEEQESALVNELTKVHQIEAEITKALAKVRGGHKYTPKEIDRPDLAMLKDEH
jgi:hypothetical protein